MLGLDAAFMHTKFVCQTLIYTSNCKKKAINRVPTLLVTQNFQNFSRTPEEFSSGLTLSYASDV